MYRTKPGVDELFSSWLVRQAWGSAVRLQTFVTRVLGMPPSFLAGDIDRLPNFCALQHMCDGTAISMERARQTGLAAFEGSLWGTYVQKGPLGWVLPIGRDPHNGRHRKAYGQQYCRRCLLEDESPYFRRQWRLAFQVVCVRHRIYLRDACPACHGPIEFHAGDFGLRLLDLGCPIVRCSTCRCDLRASIWPDTSAATELVDLQMKISEALIQGWHAKLPGAGCYSPLFFEGLRTLLRLVVQRGRFGRVRDALLASAGLLALSPPADGLRPLRFEELRLGDRAVALHLVARLLQAWPETFVSLCQANRVSGSYISDYRAPLPYWLQTPIKWHLFDLDYAPSREERAAVTSYLKSRGYPISQNLVNEWLGVSSNTRRPIPEDERKRWNPRGPRKKFQSCFSSE